MPRAPAAAPEAPAGAAPSLDCPHFPPCLGCPLIPEPYAEQLLAKRRQLADALGSLVPDLAIVAPTIPSPRLQGYRNQARLVFRRMSRGGHRHIGLGLYLPGTHRVVHIPRCPIQPERMNEIAMTVTQIAEEMGLSVYDERQGGGALRYLALRCDRAHKRFLVTIVVAEDLGQPLRQLAEAVRARHPEIVGIGLHLNTSKGNVVFAGADVWGQGSARLEDQIGRLRVPVSPRSFVQVNHAQAEWIYARLEERLGEPALGSPAPEIVLDLYCGIGGIALHLARPGRVVIGVEESAEAVEDARRAAHHNDVPNLRLVTARVEDFLRDPAAHGFDLSQATVRAVALNPPRSGCRPGVMPALAALAPERIAYVSCNPATLRRDLDLLGSGWILEEVTPVDMIPLTPHIESLSILRRA